METTSLPIRMFAVALLASTAIATNSLAIVQVPNSSFELGTVGQVPTHWTAEYIDWQGEYPPATGIWDHDLEKSGAAYYHGSYSLYGRAYYENTTYDSQDNPTSRTWAHSEWVNTPGATGVTTYMRGISRTAPSFWGWDSWILLMLDDGDDQVTYPLYEYRENMPDHPGETLEVNHYDSTATGADGQSWYVYTRDIPSNFDTTNLRVSIGWKAHDWYWYSGGVVAVSSYVDNVTIVPEPTMICLFGLGGLGLLRKKRRA